MRISTILILASMTTALGCPADDSDDTAGTATESTTDPATTDPATTDPATTDPATTDPATTDPATTDPATTDPATTDPATTDPGTETTDPDTGTGDTGGDSLECMAYCAAFLTTCQDKAGAGLDGADPYADEADCLDQCSGMDLGTPADMGGNTVGCRTYHVGAAAAMPDQGHCGHADADGSGVCA